MPSAVTFVVPVCHPANARNWSRVRSNLEQTAQSIANQTSPNWTAVIVANRGADLPRLPAKVQVEWVEFEPNPLYECKELERRRDATRLDKGRRVLAGLLATGSAGHVMKVDADDFISSRICGFVEAHAQEPGWYVGNGYGYQDGGRFVLLCSNFHMLCGTSLIVRADLFGLPETFAEASETYIRQMLGSHIFITEHLVRCGEPLRPLPFAGTIYRMAHPDSVSNSRGLLRSFLLNRAVLRNPREHLGRVRTVRPLNGAMRTEYFGAVVTAPEVAATSPVTLPAPLPLPVTLPIVPAALADAARAASATPAADRPGRGLASGPLPALLMTLAGSGFASIAGQ